MERGLLGRLAGSISRRTSGHPRCGSLHEGSQGGVDAASSKYCGESLHEILEEKRTISGAALTGRRGNSGRGETSVHVDQALPLLFVPHNTS